MRFLKYKERWRKVWKDWDRTDQSSTLAVLLSNFLRLIRYPYRLIVVFLKQDVKARSFGHRLLVLPFIAASYRTLHPPLHISHRQYKGTKRQKQWRTEANRTTNQCKPSDFQKTREKLTFYCDLCWKLSFYEKTAETASRKDCTRKSNFTLTEGYDRCLWLWPLFQTKYLWWHSKAEKTISRPQRLNCNLAIIDLILGSTHVRTSLRERFLKE